MEPPLPSRGTAGNGASTRPCRRRRRRRHLPGYLREGDAGIGRRRRIGWPARQSARDPLSEEAGAPQHGGGGSPPWSDSHVAANRRCCPASSALRQQRGGGREKEGKAARGGLWFPRLAGEASN